MGSFVHDMMAGAGVPTMMDANGDSVSYLPPAGPAVPLTALLSSEWTEEVRAGDGQITKTRNQMVSVPPISGSEYRLNGAFLIDGNKWAIKLIDAADTYLVRIHCVRIQRGESTRGDAK